MENLIIPLTCTLMALSHAPTIRYALIKFGGGITEMRGSIAGNTFSRNRSGAYVRSRTKPVNPNSARQQAVRASMAFLTNRWAQTLTANDRLLWNAYAAVVAMTNKLGENIFLTGFNHYIRSNMIRKQTGAPLVNAGPVIFELPAQDPTFAITASEATQDVSFAFDVTMDWSIEDDAHMFVFEGQPQNAQRNFFGGPWRQTGVISGAAPGPIVSPVDFATQFGIAEGQHLWGYARISRADGRLSEPFRSDVAVGA